MNFDGLRDRIVRMIAGESIAIDAKGFSNDMTTFTCADDVLALLTDNDENSLSCATTLAFYYAREYYTIIRELPAGKGVVDIAFLPRRSHAADLGRFYGNGFSNGTSTFFL